MILRKLLILVFLAVAVCVMGAGVGAAAVITVDDSGGADFMSIQAAVDAANEGDTIEVRSGTYVENVDVDKRLTIGSESGSGNCIVQAMNANDDVFYVTADASIIGLTIRNADGYGIYAYGSDLYAEDVIIKDNGNHGIYFYEGKNFTLRNCTIEDNGGGVTSSGYATGDAVAENNIIRNNTGYGLNIRLAQSKHATVTNNLIDNNSGTGLQCYINGVGGATIRDNVISNSGNYGAWVRGVKDTTITNMTIDGAESDGLSLYYCSNVTIKEPFTIRNADGYGIYAYGSDLYAEDVIIKDNGNHGIYFYEGKNFTLRNCTIEDNGGGVTSSGYATEDAVAENNIIRNNTGYGLNIRLAQSKHATVTNNLIDNNSGTGLQCYINGVGGATIRDNVISNSGNYGAWIFGVRDALITMNIISKSYNQGLYLHSSSNNSIYLNNLNNSDNVYSYNSNNTWNSPEQVTYQYNNSIFTNYLGNYWSDYIGTDPDGDGIGNTAYSIKSEIIGAQDKYPFMKENGWLENTRPPASITDLQNITYVQTHINWTWTNPDDIDFSHVIVYLDGVFQTNVTLPINHYNATNLTPDAEYTISTHTVDLSGNINQTWINHTARTAPLPDTIPPASVTDLQNVTRTQTSINWTWQNPSDFDFNHTVVYIDGLWKANTSNNYYNLTGLHPNTTHTFSTRTVDINGNINLTWVNDTVTTLPVPDTVLPIITITSPVNDTIYNIDSVDLNYSVNEPTAWQGYSLDGETTITLYENTNLTGLIDGLHTLTIYVNDTSGNINSSMVCFMIDITPPSIISVTLNNTLVKSGVPIEVTVNAIDENGIDTVTADGISLTLTGGYYVGTITADTSPVTVNVTDEVGNLATNTSATYTTDDTPPVINTVTLNITTPKIGEDILVTVNATENFAITSVEANGIALAHQIGNNWTGTITAIEGTHSVNISARDAAGNVGWNKSTSYTATMLDATPPASITDLQNITYVQTSINWTWINPDDIDFSHVMVYLDSVFQTNVTLPINYYNATDLIDDAEYNISTHTVDLSGNINQTWINHTARTASYNLPKLPPPEIISWGNNKTNDVSSNLKINVFETVQFNATANQTIETWNWFVNDLNQNNNFDNYSIQFDSTGTYTVKVNITNLNGTSNTCTWNIEVNEPFISISNTDILTWKGQNKTFEIKLKNIGITDITISEMNTNQSWIHSVSTMPALGPNDEKSIYFSMYVPNDISAGNYKFPLNISLDTGYVFDKQLNITIFNEPTSYVQVKIVDSESGAPIPDAMVMVDGNDTIHYVDSNGVTNIKTMPEAKSIYAFAVGYMPNYEVSYLELGQNNIEIRLSKGEVIISDFNIERLNSTEIVEAGIDLTDIDNYWVYNFSVNLTVETVDLTEYDEWFNKTVIVPQCTLPTIEYETKTGFKVIAFPLELSGNLSGNVTNANTFDPINKAKVTICGCSSETNISGMYFINGIPMGDYVAKASKKGFYDEFKPVNIVKNESTTLNFSLNPILPPPTGNITGTVKDNETNEALSDAKVWIDGWVWHSTETDLNGKYRIDDLPVGIHTVKITIDGYFSESQTVEVLDGQTIPVNFKLVKIKYGDIQGTVTNKSSGIEISGAHFYIDRDFWPSGKTDSNGEYSVNYLQVGSHTVTLSANGYYSESKTVEVLEGQTLIVDFALTPLPPLPPVPEKGYGNITGTVTDITNGQVISDADVKIDWYFGRLDETDLNGEYYFADLLEGRHTVTVRANGYYSESKTVNVVAGDTITIDFTLTPIINIPPEYGDIIGTVVDSSNGQIISGADVKIDWFFGSSDETDSDGEYYFDDLLEGRHTVTVSANGYYSESKTVTVIGNDLVTVDFALTPLPPVSPEEYGNIIGTVTDISNGQVVSGARVYVDGYFWPSDKTDLSGIYFIETLSIGRHTISVSANGYYRKSITVEVLKDQTVTVDFELIPYEYGNVEGTITDKSSKSVISGASVYIDGQWLWSSTKTDSNGYYLLETLPVGKHTIKIKANGYYSASKTVAVLKDKTITVDFELVPIYGVIKGTVRDLNTNNPILGAKVSVEGKSVNTNADGTYVIPNVKALSRSYRVVANKDDDYYYDYKDVQVKGGEFSTVDFYLKPIPQKITAPYAFLIIPGQVKVLKEMFGISVIVVNNADPIFSINDTYVNLSLPEGISLVKLKGQDGGYYNQSFEKSLGSISGGSQNGTTWVARGDRSGTYDVNTKISTTLMPFRVPLTKKDSEQINVHGKPNIEFDFIQSRYVRQGLPFTFSIGVKNPEEYPIEGVAIELFNEDFENVTLDDNPVKFIGTVRPGETKYAFWQMLPNASGFIIIDKSSFNITDPNATATFDFIADTPEGALTAFSILSKEVVNSEVHAFSGIITQFLQVHKVADKDFTELTFKFSVKTVFSLFGPDMGLGFVGKLVELFGLTGDLLTVEELLNDISTENLINEPSLRNIDDDSDLIIRISDLVKENKNVPIPNKNILDMHSPNEIHNLYNDDYNDILTLLRTNPKNNPSFNEDKQFKDLINQLQLASSQQSVLHIPNENSYVIIGNNYVTLFSATHLRHELSKAEKFDDAMFTASMFFKMGGTYFVITGAGAPAGIFLFGIGMALDTINTGATYVEHDYRDTFDKIVLSSTGNYKSDLAGLSKVYFGTMDWVNDSIISDSAQLSSIKGASSIGNAAYASLLQTTNDISLNTPDVLVTDDLFGYSIGYLNITSNNPNPQNISGLILIRNSDTQNSISQIINLSSVELQPYETTSMEFNYSGILLPGMPRNYISQAYVSVDGSMLDPLTSMFNVRNHNSTNRINLMNGTLIEKEEQSTNFTLSDYSESMIILSNEYGGDIDLHLNDPYGRHVGLNYTTGSIDYEIPGVTYSGPGIYPEWMTVRNENLTNYSISTFAMMAPESVNFSVDILTLKALDTMIVSPRKINSSISIGNTSNIIINIENLGFSPNEIHTISLDGDIKDIVSYVSYPKSIADGSVGSILLKIEPRIDLSKIYTGSLFINTTFQEMSIDLSISVIPTDSEMPGSVSNLSANSGLTWLNFTWTNPPDPDLDHTELYLNGTFLTNIPAPQNHYNITGLLSDTSYELGTRTVDTSGNINETWVNVTARTLPLLDTTPPIITFTPPTDPSDTILTTRNWTFINVSLSEPGFSWLEWNGINESMSGSGTHWYINKTGLYKGVYTYRVWANDSAGNVNVSEIRVIEIDYLTDTLPPIVTIISPLNDTTYNTDSVDLNYSVNEPTTWQGYSLDGATNITLKGNTTLTDLIDGLHTLTVYANDTFGNMNSSKVWFTIDATSPIINTASLNTTTPYAGEDILVTVNATDDSAVISVVANDVVLVPQGGYIWSGTITAIAGTHTVNVSATDTAGNIGWNNSTSYTASTQDTIPPFVEMVTLNTTTPDTGEDILVTVNATDNAAVINVEANGVALVSQDGDVWKGTITAMAGTHVVNVSATDAAGNVGWNNSTSYTATTQDTIQPVVEMVILNTTTLDTGEDILVTVNATDNVAVISVVANDIALVPQSGDIWSGTITAIAGTHAVNVSATDTVGNVGWNNSTSYTATTQDTTPPAIISNLHNNSGTTWINWTWTNPPDPDFNHTEIYLNGIFQTNKSAEFFNATGLIPNTEYEISTRTADNLGNINETWVNDTTMTLDTPPVSNASGPYTGIEGQAIIFNASASYDTDPGDSIAIFEWDFNNDGATDATGMEVTWTWNDDYAGQVNLTVADSHGESNTDTTSVNVLNAPPVVEAGNDQTVDEGDTVSFIGNFTDPGTGDTHTIEWNFGDGTLGSTGTLEPTHVYADNGTYTVTLTVTDDNAASTSDTLNMTVENIAPIVDAGVDQIANEGDIVSFVGNFTDPGTADTHLIEWDFGDETPISSGTLTPTHTYTDNGTYAVNLTVTDDDGASTSDTLNVTVNNVAPVLDEDADQTVQWGDTMTFSRSFTDPGDDSWTAEIDWGDGSQEEGILSSKIITATHVYSIPDEYICTLTVLDDDGGLGSGNMQITVTTRATELEYIGDLSAQYSDYIKLKAQLNDSGNNNPLPDRSISFILGTQTATATTGPDGIATTSFKLDQPAGSYDIKAEFAGDDSYSPDSDTKVMQISKEDTEITYTGDPILPTTAGSIDLRATLEEIDTEYGDLTEINVNFNIYKSSDLSYSDPVATIPSIASISVTSSGMGVGTATATIDNLPEDDYMIIARIVPNNYYLSISSNPTPMIVYEPTDQFTTGGGWIWDPTGSHGNFGFNVRYNKNGKVKGNSIYVYRLDRLDYIVKSNAWTGLAISDNTSTFQGKAVLQIFDPVTGELQPESSGNFQFTVGAMDNELNGNPDNYKITVLDKDGLEYHNATGSLEGGNIVIHDKKSK